MWPHLVPGGGCAPLPRAGQCPLCAALGALGASRPPPCSPQTLPSCRGTRFPHTGPGEEPYPAPSLLCVSQFLLGSLRSSFSSVPFPPLGQSRDSSFPQTQSFPHFFPPKFPSLLQPHSSSHRSSQGSAHSWVWGFWQLLPPFPLGRGFARTEISGQLEEADLYFRDGSSHRVL